MTCTMEWDRKNDKFTLGQWFKGRIYQYRCDLSPDGRSFIFFAANHKTYPFSWTAISYSPFLTARVFYPWSWCWNGGGAFLNDNVYWLFASKHDKGKCVQIDAEFKRKEDVPEGYSDAMGECPGIYFSRIQRDGWTIQDQTAPSEYQFRKTVDENWTLERTFHLGSQKLDAIGQKTPVYWESYQLIHKSGNIQKMDWEWADIDSDRGIVITKDGKVFRANIEDKQKITEVCVYDLNDMSFENVKAPYQGVKWRKE